MKKLLLIFLVSTLSQLLYSQSIAYHRLEDLVAGKGDTIEAPRTLSVEKRNTVMQKLTQTGGDYKISANSSMLGKALNNRYFAARIDDVLYINCKKVRIKKFRFGKFHAKAMMVNNNIYFCATPVGPAAVAVVDRNIGMGAVGEAIASSSVLSQRVYYEIDAETGEVTFVGKEKMCELLAGYPELKEAYLKENNQEAKVTEQYLKELCAIR